MSKKILYICIGAAAILLGILCVFYSELLFILCGFGLLLYGIGQLFHWRERKKAGAAGIWTKAGMIVAIAFGLFVLIGNGLGYVAVRFLLLSISIWLIAEGILEILGAVMYRKAMTSVDLGVQAPGSVSSMVLGSAMVLIGILGILFPVVAEYAVGIWIVAELIVTGIRMIFMARSAGILGESTE